MKLNQVLQLLRQITSHTPSRNAMKRFVIDSWSQLNTQLHLFLQYPQMGYENSSLDVDNSQLLIEERTPTSTALDLNTLSTNNELSHVFSQSMNAELIRLFDVPMSNHTHFFFINPHFRTGDITSGYETQPPNTAEEDPIHHINSYAVEGVKQMNTLKLKFDNNPKEPKLLPEAGGTLILDDSFLRRPATLLANNLFNDNSSAGNDGLKSKVFSLAFNSSITTGLIDTQSNQAVHFEFSKNGYVMGKTESGEKVLRFKINEETGDITVKQFRALKHNDPNDHDEANTPLKI